MKNNKQQLLQWLRRGVFFCFGVIVLTLILLSISNYPVQWRVQVDAERRRSTEVLAQAIRYYYLDHDQTLFGIPTSTHMIANTDSCGAAVCARFNTPLPCFDLQQYLVPNYIHALEQDVAAGSSHVTGYYISRENGGVTIGACNSFFKLDPLSVDLVPEK